MDSSNVFPTKNIYYDDLRVFEKVYQFQKHSVEPNGRGDVEKGINKERLEQSGMEDNALFVNMRGFLIFGRVLALIPTSGIVFNTRNGLRFKILSVPTILNMIVGGLIGITVAFAANESYHQGKSNALELAGSVQGSVFRMWAFFNYVYFLLRADSFLSIFKTWERTSSSLTYPVEDKTLKRDILLICLIIFSSATFETIILHMEYFPQFDQINGKRHQWMGHDLNKSTLEYYYERSNWEFRNVVGYDPVVAMACFVVHKYVMSCWNYVDALIIVFARALYAKFKGLREVAEDKLKLGQQPSDQSCWRNIVKDHEELCSLLETFENFFSPLIFGSYAVNIYYICMQLIEGLSSARVDSSILHSIYAPASFLTITIRVFLVTNMGAKINTHAHGIGNVLKKCPIECYDAEVARVDRHVTSGPEIGLTGLGMFTLKQPLLLSIVNVVFTALIVLLQSI